MGKVVFKNMLRALAVNFVGLIPTAILIAILASVGAQFNLWWTLAGAIPPIAVIVLYHMLRGDKIGNGDCIFNRKVKNYVSIKKFCAANCAPLVIAALSLVFLVAFIVLVCVEPARDAAVSAAPSLAEALLPDKNGEYVGAAIVSAILGNIVVSQTGAYIVVMKGYQNNVMCPQCKNVLSVVAVSLGDLSVTETTTYKTDTERRQVGSIKGAGTEIGIYADVQNTTANTTVKETQRYNCKCLACGKAFERFDVRYKSGK